MNESLFIELSAWLTQAGLAGTHETDIFLCSVTDAEFEFGQVELGQSKSLIKTKSNVHAASWDLPQGQGSRGKYSRSGVFAVEKAPIHVHFGSLADIAISSHNVRFTPDCGHGSARF